MIRSLVYRFDTVDRVGLNDIGDACKKLQQEVKGVERVELFTRVNIFGKCEGQRFRIIITLKEKTAAVRVVRFLERFRKYARNVQVMMNDGTELHLNSLLIR